MVESGVEAAPQPEPARILVVEDDPLTRFAMAEALRELGVSVVEAASADEAWNYVTAGESVDLVFTDHRMPGSMKKYPMLTVIVTSSYFDDQEWTEPVLTKPYNLFETAADLAARALVKPVGRQGNGL
jgi:CheY-like chemotaxis protein